MEYVVLLVLVALLAAVLVLLVRSERRAAGAEALGAEVARLASTVDARLRSSQESSERRLADAGQTMAQVRERLAQVMEATRRMEAVGASVGELQSLLRVQTFRGAFGEVMLEEMLRQVLPRQCYELQYGFRSGERVDAAIRLAGQIVPVDSKFPLEACQRLLAANGDAAAAERERRAMMRSVKDRVDEIASKYIRPDEGTSDFALMYVPAESVYYEACVRDQRLDDERGLLAYAMARRVIPVSPHTFYAYLSAILFGLKGLRVEAEAREIHRQLGALGQEFGKFWAAFEKVGLHLGNAQKQYLESERARVRLEQQLESLGSAGAVAPPPGPVGAYESDRPAAPSMSA